MELIYFTLPDKYNVIPIWYHFIDKKNRCRFVKNFLGLSLKKQAVLTDIIVVLHKKKRDITKKMLKRTIYVQQVRYHSVKEGKRSRGDLQWMRKQKNIKVTELWRCIYG